MIEKHHIHDGHPAAAVLTKTSCCGKTGGEAEALRER